MVDLKNIRPVSDFNRNTKAHIQRLKRTGRAEVLTVNGHAELVVQSADAYQKLLERAELADTLAGLQRSLEQADRGELRSASAFFNEVASKFGIKL